MHRQALDLAVSRGFALSRHGFIDGLSGWPNDLMTKYWKTNQLIAESNWSYDQVKDQGSHGSMKEHVDAFARWHSAFAHMYLHAASYRRAMREDRAEFERALKPGGVGYRLVPVTLTWRRSVAAGGVVVLRQEWVNRNSSFCPRRFPLRLELVGADGRAAFSAVDGDIHQEGWIAGPVYPVSSAFRLPEDLKPGAYDLRIALVDEQGQPRVKLGIEGADSESRYRLGTLRITPPGR